MTPPTQTGRPPWEIEIRDRPRPAAPEPPERRGPGRRLVALVVLGVACFAATVALLGWLLGDDDGGTDEAAPPTTTPITFAPRDDATTTTAAPTSTTASTTTTTSPTTTTTTPPTTTTTTTAAPAGATGSVPSLPSSFGGGWVALLTSVPYSAGEARLEAAWQEVRRVAPDARATRAEEWASLNDGNWALVHPGPFASAADVRAWCARIDTSRSDCAARELRRG